MTMEWMSGAALGAALMAVIGLAGLAVSRSRAARCASYAEDRAAIEQLEAEYLFAMDWGDAESYAQVFAPDGVLEWARGRAVGPAEIYEEAKRFKTFIGQLYGNDASGRPVVLRHFITNPAIFIHGERAKGRIYWFELVNTGPASAPVVGAYGHYEDEMRKVDGQWKFVHRRIFNEQLEDRRAGPDNPVRAAREA